MKEGIEMSKNKDEINKKLDELGRIAVQLHISLLNRKYKYIENDFEAIGRCLAELKELVNNDEWYGLMSYDYILYYIGFWLFWQQIS